MPATIKITGGGRPDQIELRVEDALPTEGDLLYAAQLQRSKILHRTERGLDYQGRPFAPYSKKRPYYWYPNGPVGRSLPTGKANVRRVARKLGAVAQITRSGLGIRFASYDAFKRTGLGRSGVDLRGPRAPHMLQEITIKAGSQTRDASGRDEAIGINDMTTPADSMTVGIYGEAANRAAGHNSDDRPRGMPLRRFMAASDEDKQDISRALHSRWLDRHATKYGNS